MLLSLISVAMFANNVINRSNSDKQFWPLDERCPKVTLTRLTQIFHVLFQC